MSVSNGPRGHRGRLERGHGISLALLQTRHHLNPALCHALQLPLEKIFVSLDRSWTVSSIIFMTCHGVYRLFRNAI